MPGATSVSLANILQNNYLPGIEEQFNADTPNLRFIKQNSTDVNAEGTQAVIALQTALNEGGSFHGESSDVADSGVPGVRTVAVTLKQYTHRARLTYRLMKKSKTNAASFARGMQFQMTSTREAFVLTANGYLWGDGTGVMARVSSEDIAGTSTLVAYKGYGLANGGAPSMVLRPGQVIHILDTSTYTGGVSNDRGKGTISTVNEATAGQLTLAIASGHTLSGVTTGDYIFLQNTIQGWTDSGETDDNRPAMGLLGMYGSATLQGLSSSTEPQWQGGDVTINQSTAIQDLRICKSQLAKRVKNGRIAYLVSSYETHMRYAMTLDSKVEFHNVQSLDAFWDVTTFEGRPWFMDHTAPDSQIFFVPAGDFVQRYAVTDFIDMVSDSGGGPLNLVPNKTVFDVFLTAIYEYGCKRRNTLIRGTGMTWSYS